MNRNFVKTSLDKPLVYKVLVYYVCWYMLLLLSKEVVWGKYDEN